jgi:flavodoxin
MRALVVYESMYGNTATVGDAIADELRTRGFDVEAGLISKIGPDETVDVDVLVVGGPTHVHGMSRASTRKAAVEDAENTFPDRSVEPGLRDWVEQLPPGAGRLAAAFDTRIDKPAIITGSAAKGIGHRLEEHGFSLVTKPESFFVSTQNTLLADETERAAAWADKITERVAATEASLAR